MATKYTIFFLLFFCVSFCVNAQKITAAEYFIDKDPGKGNGTQLNTGTSAGTVAFTDSVATNTLDPGFHFLCVRAKGEDDTWGIFETRGFFVSKALTSNSKIIAAEYFIDKDPGVGNGTKLT